MEWLNQLMGFNNLAGNQNTQASLYDPSFQILTGTGSTNGIANQSGSSLLGSMGGWNGLNSLAGIVGSLGNLYGAYQANNLAKDQFNFQKQAYQTNLSNQIKTYNTALEDRIRSRTAAENGTQSQADDYLKKNRL